jgi:hypothetical protein
MNNHNGVPQLSNFIDIEGPGGYHPVTDFTTTGGEVDGGGLACSSLAPVESSRFDRHLPHLLFLFLSSRLFSFSV